MIPRHGQRYDKSQMKPDRFIHKSLLKRFGSDITPVYENLLNNEQFLIALNSIRYALVYFELKIFITGAEKWDLPTKDNDWGKKEKAEGPYDVEGHAWTDINAEIELNLFDKIQRSRYLDSISYGIREVFEATKTYLTFMFKKPNVKINRLTSKWNATKTYLKILKTLPAIFSTKRSYWIWTVETYESFLNNLSEEIAFEENPISPDKDLELSTIDMATKRIKSSLTKSLDRDTIMAESGYMRLDNSFWVNIEDPTNIVVDTYNYKPEMKDGLSNKDVDSIITRWIRAVTGFSAIKTRKVKQPSHSRLSLDLKVGMLDVELGNVYPIENLNDLFGDKNGENEGN